MPRPSGSSMSSASLSALLSALGLSDSTDDDYHTTSSGKLQPEISKFASQDRYRPQRPTTPFSNVEFSTEDEARIFRHDFLSDFDICSDFEDDRESDFDFETLPSRPGSSLEGFEVITPIAHQQHRVESPPASPVSFESPKAVDHIYIKAALNASIIMLRTPRDITFKELQQRLYNKFVHQENIFLSHSFSVLLALPPPSSSNLGRSASGRRRVSFACCTEMSFIDREVDWRRIADKNDGSKITLRILDTPP
ncbi:hypothetical protein JR316_0005852 [Psilocybe cubensis]|uniref:Uncharacterized protein n=2 Tax=Psilocybe cubensis TaxID=181762 RepID=A0A8H7Y019_PSICU|nr:hypothetical protein JR316_0005852 [Psilocybe cubensis]KAH9481330.1 hypothetical protein JR316_0005852 [Psilocybe cubensis]